MNEPLYSVGTYDSIRERYSPQRGLSVPSFNITHRQLRQAIRELRRLGYSAHRVRDPDGTHEDNDPDVLVERTDGKDWRSIMRDWDRWPWTETRSEARARHRIEGGSLYEDVVAAPQENTT